MSGLVWWLYGYEALRRAAYGSSATKRFLGTTVFVKRGEFLPVPGFDLVVILV